MLTADVLNQDALLNNFEVIGNLQFISGEEFELFIRIKQPQRGGLRYVAPDTATMTVYLPNKDGTMLEITMDHMPGDFSIWSGPVTSDQSEALASGNFTFELDLLGDESEIVKGWVQNGLSLVVTGDC